MTATLQAMNPRAHDATDPPFPAPVIGPADMTGTWFVAAVAPNRTRTVAASLGRVDGMAFYLPMERVTRRYGDRQRRAWHRILFPGYIFFCCGDGEAEYALRKTRDGIRAIIEVRNQKRLVRELSEIHRATLAGEVQVWRLPAVGQRVRVTDGPFTNFEGTVELAGDRALFVLSITMLGCGLTPLHVSPDKLEIIEGEVAA